MCSHHSLNLKTTLPERRDHHPGEHRCRQHEQTTDRRYDHGVPEHVWRQVATRLTRPSRYPKRSDACVAILGWKVKTTTSPLQEYGQTCVIGQTDHQWHSLNLKTTLPERRDHLHTPILRQELYGCDPWKRPSWKLQLSRFEAKRRSQPWDRQCGECAFHTVWLGNWWPPHAGQLKIQKKSIILFNP